MPLSLHVDPAARLSTAPHLLASPCIIILPDLVIMENSAVNDNNAPRGKEKRFGCSYCDRLFARKEHAERHSRTHTQEKPFQCPQCDSRFTRRYGSHTYLWNTLTKGSDLLVRHERLTHKKNNSGNNDDMNQPVTKKRRRTQRSLEEHDESVASPSNASTLDQPHISVQSTNSGSSMYEDREPTFPTNTGHDFLATLSFAAEQAALQDSLASPATNMQSTLTVPPPSYGHQRSATDPYSFDSTMNMPSFSAPAPPAHMSSGPSHAQDMALTEHLPDLGFEGSLDSLAAFLDNGALSSYHFSSVISAEQPVPFFSPESLSLTGDALPEAGSHLLPPNRPHSPTKFEEQSSFSRFGSRLPSLQPEERPPQSKARKAGRRHLADISLADRQAVVNNFNYFSSAVSAEFKLPSRLALSRYLAAYISGFHEHLPFLHIPTMKVESSSIELVLAMAAVGAQYCFEGDRGVELFHASQAIASQRIRRKDSRMAASHYDNRSSSVCSRNSMSHLDQFAMPSYAGTPDNGDSEKEDLMQTAQALLILMAMATWAKHKEILREALAIQSVLATLVREDGLKAFHIKTGASWEEWVHVETVKRTKFIVFCFFNLHCIVYNIPPLILNCTSHPHGGRCCLNAHADTFHS